MITTINEWKKYSYNLIKNENFLDKETEFDWSKYDGTAISGAACDEMCEEIVNYIKDYLDKKMPFDVMSNPYNKESVEERKTIINEWTKIFVNKMYVMYASAGANYKNSNFNQNN